MGTCTNNNNNNNSYHYYQVIISELIVVMVVVGVDMSFGDALMSRLNTVKFCVNLILVHIIMDKGKVHE